MFILYTLICKFVNFMREHTRHEQPPYVSYPEKKTRLLSLW